MRESPPVLSLRGVRRRIGEGFEVSIDSLTLRRGEIVALLGPSGCGKSTTLDLISTLLRPEHAEAFNFQPIDHRAPHDIAALWRSDDRDALTRIRGTHMGYVLQTGGLIPFLTVHDNIAAAVRVAGAQVSGQEIYDTLHCLEMSHKAMSLPGQLSIGQRQRVAIARAIIHKPSLVLADEPTASLDPHLKREALALLLGFIRGMNAAGILVTHDTDLIEEAGIDTLIHLRCSYDGTMERASIHHPVEEA